MKTKEHESIITALREGARLLDWDTKSLEHAITKFQDEWGSETFYAEVNGILYEIAPVDQ